MVFVSCNLYAQIGSDSKGNYLQNVTFSSYNFGTVSKLRIGTNVTTSTTQGPVVTSGLFSGKINDELHIYPQTIFEYNAGFTIMGRNNTLVLDTEKKKGNIWIDKLLLFKEPNKGSVLLNTLLAYNKPALQIRPSIKAVSFIFDDVIIIGRGYFNSAEKYKLYVEGTIHTDDVFITDSDERLKSNIANINVSTENLIKTVEMGTLNVERIKELAPNLVNSNQHVDMIGLIPLVIEALKSQQIIIDNNNLTISRIKDESSKVYLNQ